MKKTLFCMSILYLYRNSLLPYHNVLCNLWQPMSYRATLSLNSKLMTFSHQIANCTLTKLDCLFLFSLLISSWFKYSIELLHFYLDPMIVIKIIPVIEIIPVTIYTFKIIRRKTNLYLKVLNFVNSMFLKVPFLIQGFFCTIKLRIILELPINRYI